jgi:hypothetical protein
LPLFLSYAAVAAATAAAVTAAAAAADIKKSMHSCGIRANCRCPVHFGLARRFFFPGCVQNQFLVLNLFFNWSVILKASRASQIKQQHHQQQQIAVERAPLSKAGAP